MGSKMIYLFDWGQETVPADIAAKAAAAPKRSFMVSDPEGGDDIERSEPDCPELDEWARQKNAKFFEVIKANPKASWDEILEMIK